MFTVMNINRLLQTCLRTYKVFRTRATRAAKESDARADAPTPTRAALLGGAWSVLGSQ